jgi:hypothetical protein
VRGLSASADSRLARGSRILKVITEPRDEKYRLHYRAHALDPDEVLVATWTASRNPGIKLLGAGGKLVLTTKRLLYEPMRTPLGALPGVAGLFGVEKIGGLVKSGVDATGSLDQWSAP